jgi:hypothetical protein
MRNGTVWSDILSNLKQIKSSCPNVSISFNCVVGIFNVLTITEFLDHLHENGIIDLVTTSCSFYKLINPDYYNLNNVLSKELKKEAKEKIGSWLDTVPDGHIKNGLSDIYHFIQEDVEPNKEWQQKFKSLTTHFDAIREETFIGTFPELRAWYENIE